MTSREDEFHEAMVEIYLRAKAECGYNAVRFLQMLAEHGGLGTAKRLLASDDIQYGFTELWERGRVDPTVEAHVLKDEFEGLFSAEERQRARSRLKAHGYEP
jgi:hypothetical protein